MKPEDITPQFVDRMMLGMGLPVDGIWRPNVERGLRALCDRRKSERRATYSKRLEERDNPDLGIR